MNASFSKPLRFICLQRTNNFSLNNEQFWAIFMTPADIPPSCFQTENDLWLMIANSQNMLGREKPKCSQPLLHVEPRLLSHRSAFPHRHPQVLLVKPRIFGQLVVIFCGPKDLLLYLTNMAFRDSCCLTSAKAISTEQT